MTTEETHVELKDTAVKDAQDAAKEDAAAAVVDPPQVPAPEAAADATEADVSEADLDAEEQEKVPMTGGCGAENQGEDRAENGQSAGGEGEKNGSIKLKIPDEDDDDDKGVAVKFTGLSKEELLRVAGTPGWVRTRWALLVVFWLGWLGMLGGAVLIILRAPPCRDLPPTDWWNHGPLYQLNVKAFTETGNIKGLEQKIPSLSQMKVKGLVLGPIHVAPADDVMNLRFEEISPEVGNLEDFKRLVQAAHKKGIFVVLDLSPNYQGTSGPWFSNSSVTNVAERLKSALVFWMDRGIDGVQLSGVERVANIVPSLWNDIRAIVQNGTTEERTDKRVLIGLTERSSAAEVSSLLSSSGVDLLISDILVSRLGSSQISPDATEHAQSLRLLYGSHVQTSLAWSMGGPAIGHMASLVGPWMVRFYQLLLLTLPGTPVFNYGDEIALQDMENNFPKMIWDSEEELNGTLLKEQSERISCRKFFRFLSDLRSKERSLLYGDFLLLHNSSSALAYSRVWDQSHRYVAIFNWDANQTTLELNDPSLPTYADVMIATNSSAMPADSSVDLGKILLGPEQAALLRFPYTG